jgi:hypothetical protein
MTRPNEPARGLVGLSYNLPCSSSSATIAAIAIVARVSTRCISTVRPASSKPTRPRSAGPLDALSPRRGVAYGRCRHRPRDSGKCSRVNAPACHLQDRAPAGQWQRSGRVRVWNPAACRPRNKRSGTPNTSPSDQLTLPSENSASRQGCTTKTCFRLRMPSPRASAEPPSKSISVAPAHSEFICATESPDAPARYNDGDACAGGR